MLKKESTKKGIKVTFEVEKPEAEVVEVLGTWNDWQPESLKKFKNGKHKATVTLPEGEHQFRYLADRAEWLDEPEADKHVYNTLGSQNSVVVC